MSSLMPRLNHLLAREHIALTRALSQATTPKAHEKVAQDALSLASRLLAERESPHETHSFMEVTLWLFDRLEDFVTRWPDIARDTLGIDLPVPSKKDRLADKANRLARALDDSPLAVLMVQYKGGSATPAPVIVIDPSLASTEARISFLFALVLQREPGPNDFTALSQLLSEEDDQGEVFALLIDTVINSREAQDHPETWYRL